VRKGNTCLASRSEKKVFGKGAVLYSVEHLEAVETGIMAQVGIMQSKCVDRQENDKERSIAGRHAQQGALDTIEQFVRKCYRFWGRWNFLTDGYGGDEGRGGIGSLLVGFNPHGNRTPGEREMNGKQSRRGAASWPSAETSSRAVGTQGKWCTSSPGPDYPKIAAPPSPGLCPGGTFENSPAIYRWVSEPRWVSLVPKGRLNGPG
jgi:hypothetical protein